MRINNIYNQFFVKARLLTTISIVLFVAGIVTLNLNSSVWAKDDDKINSNDSFRMFDIIDGKENTQTNDNGNTQTNDNGNTQTNDNGNKNPIVEISKSTIMDRVIVTLYVKRLIDDAMDMMDNLF